MDRDAEDAAGTFGGRVAELRPDVVADLVCFTAASARQLVDALRPSRPLLLHCGTIWVHGPALRVPVTEDEPAHRVRRVRHGQGGDRGTAAPRDAGGRRPLGRAAPRSHQRAGLAGDHAAGNLDPAVWTSLATGKPLALPDHGLGVLHHVHADDVAQAFERALSRPAAIGASFHVVAEQAMTLRGLAAGVARWFGREPELDFVDWPEFERRTDPGTPRPPASTRSAASPRASPGPARCSATRPGTARSRPFMRPWPGSSPHGQADTGGQPFPAEGGA